MTAVEVPRGRYEPEPYWESLISNRFDLREVGYPWLSLAYNRWLYTGMEATVRRGLQAVRPGGVRGARVLDVGAGVGFWIDFWRRREAGEVVGIDLAPSSVERLSQRHPELTFERRDIADPVDPAWEHSFDVISAMSILHHITDQDRWEAALANLGRLLAPGGTLIVMDPIARSTCWGARDDAAANGRVRTVEQHVAGLAERGVELSLSLPTVSILTNPVDTRRPGEFAALEAWWKAFSVVAEREMPMRAAGPLVYGVDRALCRLGYAPTSKTLFFRGPAAAPAPD